MNAIMGWLAGILALIPGFGTAPQSQFTGYVDADYVYVAPISGGAIARLAVKEGQSVKQGEALFSLTDDQQAAAVAAAKAQAEAAQANWDNLTTGGRAEELAASRAAVTKAKADLQLAETTFSRSQTLFKQNVITQAQLDQNRASVDNARAALDQASAQLAVTGLPARTALQDAARASFEAAQANVEAAQANLADREVAAPVAGRVERIYYSVGEVATAGAPVLSLLPDAALKVKFYVGETDRTKFTIGEAVRVDCDGCAADLAATVSYLASSPQYTSPIIYSREERGQLVYLAEARLTGDAGVQPGQPVSVSLSP